MAARITSPSGVSLTTNTRLPNKGQFDSWVMISARDAMVHPWAALTIGDREDLITSTDWDVDMYYVKFVDEGSRIVDSIHHNHPADHHFYSWPQPGWPRMSSVAFRAGERRNVVFPPGVPSGCKLEVNTRRGQASAARVAHRSGQDLKQTSEFGRVTYIDQHGNTVPALIAVSNDGNRLSLQATGQHPLTDQSGKSAAADEAKTL